MKDDTKHRMLRPSLIVLLVTSVVTVLDIQISKVLSLLNMQKLSKRLAKRFICKVKEKGFITS